MSGLYWRRKCLLRSYLERYERIGLESGDMLVPFRACCKSKQLRWPRIEASQVTVSNP